MFIKFTGTVLMALFLLTGMTFVMAQDATPTATPSPTATPTETPSPTTATPSVDLICLQIAVEKRDNAIIAAWDTVSSSIKTALQNRRDSLKSAWGISIRKDRNKAITSAWSHFRSARIIARGIFIGARRAAWDQFYADKKSCGNVPGPESRGSEVNF